MYRMTLAGPGAQLSQASAALAATCESVGSGRLRNEEDIWLIQVIGPDPKQAAEAVREFGWYLSVCDVMPGEALTRLVAHVYNPN